MQKLLCKKIAIIKDIHSCQQKTFNIRKVITIVINIPSCQQRTYITGKGKIQIGYKCQFGYKMGGFYRKGCIELQARYENSFIKIGNRISTNNNLFICAANYIEIGNDVLIGQGVCFMDHEAHGIAPENRKTIGDVGKIIIGNNVWIGNNVTILKNTEIGENSIVAAHAVVNGKFPNNVIIGGVPAKIIKEIKCGN
jgi:acetyltransferase-like isoleucine patch superfamily enzyme